MYLLQRKKKILLLWNLEVDFAASELCHRHGVRIHFKAADNTKIPNPSVPINNQWTAADQCLKT